MTKHFTNVISLRFLIYDMNCNPIVLNHGRTLYTGKCIGSLNFVISKNHLSLSPHFNRININKITYVRQLLSLSRVLIRVASCLLVYLNFKLLAVDLSPKMESESCKSYDLHSDLQQSSYILRLKRRKTWFHATGSKSISISM